MDEDEEERVASRLANQGGLALVSLLRRARLGDAVAAEIAHDVAWEQLHSAPWNEVDIAWRDGYALACLYRSRELQSCGMNDEAIKLLDMGLMMGGLVLRPRLNVVMSSLQAVHGLAGQGSPVKQEDGLFEAQLHILPSGSLVHAGSIRRVELPSLGDFLSRHFVPRLPVIVTGAMVHWPAIDKWRDFSYFSRIAGSRTVPIEVGENYLADGWKQELMTLSQFLTRIRESVTGTNRPYLAQHPLFDQIPELRRDIMVPDYCSCGEGELHSINAWFGPSGTVTPLHHDPHHNLLAQVVGKKYVRLYPADASNCLYPYEEAMLHNSSQVDLDNPDYARFPLAKNLDYVDCVLEDGEMLYIPPKWWHYVKALSPSFSVSFWWRDE